MPKHKVTLFIAIALCILSTWSYAEETTGNAGKTKIAAYMEFTYLDDRGMGWTGSETTFYLRGRLNIQHYVHDDVVLNLTGEYRPTVNTYSRAFNQLKQREGNPNDTYMQFIDLAGYPMALRLGVVKVPYGQFDTMSLDNRSRPMSTTRTREWDYGARLDTSLSFMDVSFAIVNGEGSEGTDSNSAKSVALRLVFPATQGELYPETLEITRYPNPRTANPDGDFRWQFGASAYNGNKFSTPIKQKNSHYGADLKLDYSIFSLKAQYSFLEGGFTDPSVISETDAALAALGYSGTVTKNIDTFPHGYSYFVEITTAISEKTLFSVLGESYDPDSESNTTPQQRTKERLVLGVKHDFKKDVSGSIFYTKTYNPAFGMTGNVIENDYWKGNDILMAAIAIQF